MHRFLIEGLRLADWEPCTIVSDMNGRRNVNLARTDCLALSLRSGRRKC